MLETERLILRRMDDGDADAVFAMRSDPAIMRFIRPAQTAREEAKSWIAMISSRWQNENIGFCAAVEKQSQRFIGWCGLWRLQETGETEVGYALREEFWGKGYAVEAARRFLEYGFETLDLAEIVAVTDPNNRNSWRVMEKLGMRYDYTDLFYGRDLFHYSIAKDDWLKLQNIENKENNL